MNTQNSQAQCACSAAPKFVFPCSGASDVGGLSDLAAHQMAKDGTGKMYCLAGIGGRVDAIMANTQAAAKLQDPGAGWLQAVRTSEAGGNRLQEGRNTADPCPHSESAGQRCGPARLLKRET
jgi:hypothetical protein